MANLYEMPNATSGLDTFLVQMADTNPTFFPMLLTFIFGVVFLVGMISQKNRVGYADISMWALLSSIAVLLIVLPMTLIVGLIDIVTLGIIVALIIVFGVWFFFDKGRGEV